MRITTQMLNESARKAGLPINNTSLLNFIKNDGTGNTLLDALNKKRKLLQLLLKKAIMRNLTKKQTNLLRRQRFC